MSGVATATLAVGVYSANKASKSAQNSANTAAAADERIAQLAAEEGRFKPVGITSRFGSSQFGFDDAGRLSSAGYTATPEIQALQDRLSVLYGDSLGLAEMAPSTARGLFNLGTDYLSESPEAARQRIFNQLQETRLPAQMREEQRLGAGVFGRGRAGLNIGSMGQPELFALGQAREEQRMRDVLAAEQQAQQQIEFGTGLLGTSYQLPVQALGPFQSQFGLTQLLEETAREPLDISAQLGGRSAQAGANTGQTLLAGGLSANKTRLQGSLVGPTLQYNTLADLTRNPQFAQGIRGLFNQQPSIYNTYGQGGMGQVPMLNASPGIFDPGYYAQDR